MQDFKQLLVWQKSHQLILEVYQKTRAFPQSEQYGLTSQLRRACASIPTNIAEGSGRKSNQDFNRFLQISFGSAKETEYLLLFAHDLAYLSDDDYPSLNEKIIEVEKTLVGLMGKLA
ncbi:MAG: four helix bundle protein [Aggregatilineales bacterium]